MTVGYERLVARGTQGNSTGCATLGIASKTRDAPAVLQGGRTTQRYKSSALVSDFRTANRSLDRDSDIRSEADSLGGSSNTVLIELAVKR